MSHRECVRPKPPILFFALFFALTACSSASSSERAPTERATSLATGLAFVERASELGLDVSGGKSGGLTVGDVDGDGCPDVLVNTRHRGTRLLLCSPSSRTWTDVTEARAPGLARRNLRRSVVLGDVNHDGRVDLARSVARRLEIFLQAPAGAPFLFGDDAGEPDFFVDAPGFRDPEGRYHNAEGLGWLDADGDGWLDLLMNNHSGGVVLWANPRDGSAAFSRREPAELGLDLGSAHEGDYLAVADIEGDGDVDFVNRHSGIADLFRNRGDGQFDLDEGFALTAPNGQKGGVALCDFDGDGALDIFWTRGGRDYRHDSSANRVFRTLPDGSVEATGVPADLPPSARVQDAACGDVDLDGDEDLFLTGRDEDFLYLNESTPGEVRLRRSGALPSERRAGSSAVLADLDGDGDLDVLVNEEPTVRYWENQLTGGEPLRVRVRTLVDEASCTYRDDLGSTLRLHGPDGAPIGGLREVNGGRGHGSQDPPWVHFGLPTGSPELELSVRFLRSGEVRRVPIRTEELGAERLLILADRPCGVEICDGGGDDDLDGLADCADPDCADDARCLDAGLSQDAGLPRDGAVVLPFDGGPPDASTLVDGGTADAGASADGGADGGEDPLDPVGICLFEPCECGVGPVPEPADFAPGLDPTTLHTVPDMARFLFEGPGEVQRGVAAGALDDDARLAVLRGVVRDPSGRPVRGARVVVVDHPELGCTRSRSDGHFDLAVPGGQSLRVRVVARGHLPVERRAFAPVRAFRWVDDVVLTPLDPTATVVDLDAATEIVAARGSTVVDADGPRQGTLLFAPGNRATMALPDGSEVPLSTMTVRITEYTVGERGREAMPAVLPPGTGYTYAAELSVDEALAAGATTVRFDRPVPFYLENFLDFPAGVPVPTGWYDRAAGAWKSYESGVIVTLLAIEDGIAALAVGEDGARATDAELETWGIDLAERRALAELYAGREGETFWRVALPHFTPIDCNWPTVPPCAGQEGCVPDPGGPDGPPDEDDPCEEQGSIIECENRVLGERLPLAGTPLFLAYRSDRAPGYADGRRVTVPLLEDRVPLGLLSVTATLEVAGQRMQQVVTPTPGASAVFRWDGRDAWGRPLSGRQRARISVEYEYRTVYRGASAFGLSFGTSDLASWSSESRTAATMSFRRSYGADLQLGSFDARGLGNGGWTLSAQHFHDQEQGRILRGTGDDRAASGTVGTLRVAGRFGANRVVDCDATGASGCGVGEVVPAGPLDGDVEAVRVDADGFAFALDRDGVVHRLAPDEGPVEVVAGGGAALLRDGLGAREARVDGLDVSLDGRLLLRGDGRLAELRSDGTLRLRAGAGTSPWAEGMDARTGRGDVARFAAGDDGLVFVAERHFAGRVWRLGPDGVLVRVAGGGTEVPADGTRALDARLQVRGLDLDGEGRLLILHTVPSTGRHAVFRLGAGGSLQHLAGRLDDADAGDAGGDGGPAREAVLSSRAGELTARPDGIFAVVDDGRVRVVDEEGRIHGVAGLGRISESDFGAPLPDGTFVHDLERSTEHRLAADGRGWVLHTERFDETYWGSTFYRVRRVAGDFGFDARLIPSPDGRVLHRFEGSRHLASFDAITGSLLWELEYDAAGRLVAVRDRFGEATRLERDAAGRLEAAVGPNGQRTELDVDGEGLLRAVRWPGGDQAELDYAPGGLLGEVRWPGGGVGRFAYTSSGLLERDDGPEGHVVELTRDGDAIAVRTGAGRTTRYERRRDGNAVEREVLTPAGLRMTNRSEAASTTLEAPDGSRVEAELVADRALGSEAPLLRHMRVESPTGRTVELGMARSMTMGAGFFPETWTETFAVNGRPFERSWDAATRTFTTTTPAGRRSTMVLDARGLVVSRQRGDFLPTRYEYDARGRLVRLTRGSGPEERVTTLSRDASGRIETMLDAEARTVRFAYDDADRPVETQAPSGARTRFTYDRTGRVSGVVPPGRMTHVFAYGADGMPEGYTLPTGEVGAREYDADRALSGFTRPDGARIEYTRDGAGRVTRIGGPAGDHTVTYDAADGAIATLTTPAGNGLAFERDGAYPLAMRWTGAVEGSVELTWGDTGELEETSVNGAFPAGYVYDDDLLPTRVGQLDVARDPAAGVVEGTELYAVDTRESWNAFGERAGYAASGPGGPLFEWSLLHDRLGRTLQRAETLDGVTTVYDYEYAPDGYLTHVWRDGALVERYDYDQNGNRLGAEYPVAGASATAEYDINDRLLRYGDATLLFDTGGQLVRRTVGASETRYEYDAVGALRAVDLPDGTQVRYEVDPMGRRIARSVDGARTAAWLFDGPERIVAELDADGAIRSRFVYATRGHVPDYMVRVEGSRTRIYRFLVDPVGSVRLVVDASTGVVAQRMDYDTFGRVLLDTRPGFTPFGFAGGQYDPATGLVRFGARDYDPQTGRWTASDPIGFAGADTNPFVYVRNAPLDLIDPAGTLPQALVCGLVGAGVSALTDVGMQLLENGGRFGCVDWRRTAREAVVGGAIDAVTCGVSRFLPRIRPRLPNYRGPSRLPCGASFAAGTLVRTPAGDQPIEALREGDRVLARDERSGAVQVRTVGRRSVRPTQPLLALTLDGAARREHVRVTPNHPFFVEGRGWVDAAELELGDALVGVDGLRVRVGGLESAPPADVYNFEVDGDHTYFAGALGVFTHNPPCDISRMLDDVVAGRNPTPGLEQLGNEVRDRATDPRNACAVGMVVCNTLGHPLQGPGSPTAPVRGLVPRSVNPGMSAPPVRTSPSGLPTGVDGVFPTEALQAPPIP